MFHMARQPPSEDGKSKSTLGTSADTKFEPNAPYELASSTKVMEEGLSEPSAEQSKDGVQDIPPDGGLLAWLQVLAGFLLVMNSR